ncbi:uncharacterized protein LOC107042174 [Diachasma alloeum]|uniref:uncharacterized protein LOC107042174 n=1 Tax=Diachasma alloeum TaxID=454923 RepID=UPI0007381A23|nr:uncharacterized protein LOC107042174 [Diachasma alloeum]
MISQILFLIFAVAVLGCHGDSIHREDNSLDGKVGEGHRVTRIKLNRWFDHYLPVIKKYMVTHGMEPMNLPAMSLPVPDIPGFKPKVELRNGLIHGLSDITRSGDIIQHIYQSSSQVDVQLSWKEVKVDYDYSLKYLFYKRKGGLTGKFLNLNIGMMASVDFKARKVDLRYLKIVDAGNFSLKLRGHLVDPVANAALKAITITFRKRMLREMEHQMNSTAQLKIKEVNNWLSNQTSIPIPRSTDEWTDLLM